MDHNEGVRASGGWTRAQLESAIRSAWSAETADHPEAWDPATPAACHCGVTSLLIRELLGGDILLADAVLEGEVIARHAWNRLSDGVEIDLTAEQFPTDVELGPPVVGQPKVGEVRPVAYDLFRRRVLDRLTSVGT